MKKLREAFLKAKSFENHFEQLSKSDSVFSKMYANLYFAVKNFIEGKDKE